MHTMTSIFQKYGFTPLATPALEYLDVLTDHYGQEGEQLVFKVLDSGNFLRDVQQADWHQDPKILARKIAHKGLRYDLTVPLARYIATHKHKLTFPFKRYQIQPVWRADRPQKGRYREFYQCDVDVVGTTSLHCEAELLAIAREVLHELQVVDATIALNHRQILQALAVEIGMEGQETALCVILDKYHHIGQKGVLEQLKTYVSDSALTKITWIFSLSGTLKEQLSDLANKLDHLPQGQAAIHDLETLLKYTDTLMPQGVDIQLMPTLARGMTYYTGAIFEVAVHGAELGSVAGGGRYDHLAEHFGLTNASGVGLSFGLDRLYQALEILGLLPDMRSSTTQVLVTFLEEAVQERALAIAASLRKQHVATEHFPVVSKLKKQLHYADKKQIPWVVLLGQAELELDTLHVRNMHTGIQEHCAIETLVDWVCAGNKNDSRT